MTKKYSFIQEEYYTDKKKRRWQNIRHGAAAAATAGLASQIVPELAAAPVITRTKMGNSTKYHESPLPDYIKNLKVNGDKNISDYMKEKGLKFSKTATELGSHYNQRHNYIVTPVKDKYADIHGKSVFAHELGHAVKLQNRPDRMAAYGASRRLTNLSVIGQLINCFNGNDESRRKIGKAISIAGGTAAIPMIAEEIGASIRGTKMLGLKGKDKARAFMGAGSYIALALSPTIMYHVSERTRNFLRRLKKIKNENPEVQNNINILKNQDIKVEV